MMGCRVLTVRISACSLPVSGRTGAATVSCRRRMEGFGISLSLSMTYGDEVPSERRFRGAGGGDSPGHPVEHVREQVSRHRPGNLHGFPGEQVVGHADRHGYRQSDWH